MPMEWVRVRSFLDCIWEMKRIELLPFSMALSCMHLPGTSRNKSLSSLQNTLESCIGSYRWLSPITCFSSLSAWKTQWKKKITRDTSTPWRTTGKVLTQSTGKSWCRCTAIRTTMNCLTNHQSSTTSTGSECPRSRSKRRTMGCSQMSSLQGSDHRRGIARSASELRTSACTVAISQAGWYPRIGLRSHAWSLSSF